MEKTKRKAHIRLPARASLWYVATSALQRSVGVIGTPIFTRLLTAGEYGLFPLYNTWLGIITVIVTLEITGGIALRGLQKYKERRSEYISASVGLIGCVFLIICVLYYAFKDAINQLTGLSTFITSVMLVQIFANAAINLYTQECKYSYNYKTVAIINIFSALTSPFIAVMLIILTPFGAEARIFAGAIVSVIIAAPIIYTVIKRGKTLFDLELWRYLLKAAIPLLPHYISMSVILRVGEITIGRVHGTEALGRYSVALSVGMSISIITNGLLSALSPWMLRKLDRGKNEQIRKLLLLLTRGLSLFCLLVLSVVPELVRIITPSEYHGCLIAVYPLSLSAIPTFLSGVVTQGAMYYERSSVSAIPSVCAAVISTVLSLAVLPRVDWRFVSLFVLLSYLILFILNSLTFKKLSGEYPIDMKKTAATYLLCVVYASFLLLLKDYPLARAIAAIPLIPPLVTLGIRAYGEIKERSEA